jgi:hypothetical protein
MKAPIDMNETEIRARFDFSKATRGRFAARYQSGHTVTLLDHDPDEVEAISPTEVIETTRKSGMRIFESQVRQAGLRLVEPPKKNGIDYLIYTEAKSDSDMEGTSVPVKLKTSIHEVFSLYKKDSTIPRLLVTYVWHAKEPQASEVYALTYDEALQIVESKPYSSTKSWIDEGGYSVTHAGAELKEMLQEFRMTPKKWRQRLQSI